MNISFRNTDFIAPDRASQINQGGSHTGYGWGTF
jgi:hypothetical protein